ncbi:Ead/Ea22-like family protein [Citrobacter freundii]|uniref:ead/Ea22-like family protein n=1 Tax=Citrobacter freundii TaxID=546 RepID=UPI003B22C8FB
MTALNKQALREMAERAASDSWGYDRDEFNDAITPEVVLALLDELEAAENRNAELEARAVTPPQNDYFASLVAMARVSADKAMRKFPQPNYVLLKVAEEAGEVVQAGVHYAENRMEWEQVEGEIVQLLAMLIRLVTEGDQINGVTPPASYAAGIGVKGE